MKKNLKYISTLQQKCEWLHNTSSLKTKDLAINKNDQLFPWFQKNWQVSEIKPSSDGCARVVTVTTYTGQFKRAVTKLWLLPIKNRINWFSYFSILNTHFKFFYLFTATVLCHCNFATSLCFLELPGLKARIISFLLYCQHRKIESLSVLSHHLTWYHMIVS